MAWTPPMNFEERMKARFVPPALQRWYHVQREQRRGERELRLVPLLADPRRVSVDAGANRGVWTEVLRRHSRRVCAFEPNPKMCAELRRCARPDVEVFPLALSDRSGHADLLVPQNDRGYSNQGASLSPARIGDGRFGVMRVETRRLDDLALDDVGFIKIDVEGHELEVLEGARETLRRHRPTLVVEIEERHHTRPIAELLATVCGFGYHALCLQRGTLRPSAQFDLVAWHSKPASRADYVFNWIFLPT